MHGVRRDAVSHTQEARAARRHKEAAKLSAYRQLEDDFFAKRAAGQMDQDALHVTTKLLTTNPELYTAWNFRRKVLSHLFTVQVDDGDDRGEPTEPPDFFSAARPDADRDARTADAHAHARRRRRRAAQRKRELLAADLELTEHALRANPKVYWIWNHRKWCLDELPDRDDGADEADDDHGKRGARGAKWRAELRLADRMLALDPRNFHGWEYRRHLVSGIAAADSGPPSSHAPRRRFPASLSDDARLDADPESTAALSRLARDELDFTLAKVEANFSNFSAWHHRSLLLPRLWDALRLAGRERASRIDQELELVRQAMYTDPSDQSVWLYHRWLVEREANVDRLRREIESIEELLQLEPDGKWCLQALGHYRMLLAAAVSVDGDDDDGAGTARRAEEAERNRSLAASHYERLRVVDADRAAMYRDLMKHPVGVGVGVRVGSGAPQSTT